jgi:hypothetical protein
MRICGWTLANALLRLWGETGEREGLGRELRRLVIGVGRGVEKSTHRWIRWKSVRCPLSAEYMHIGATQIRFWNVTLRILRGVKSVGGFLERAVPAGGFWMGVK